MSGSLLHGSWEISSTPEEDSMSGGTEKATSHNAVVNVGEKSDRPNLPGRLPNKAGAAEAMEGRGLVAEFARVVGLRRPCSPAPHSKQRAYRDCKQRLRRRLRHLAGG